VERGFMRFSCCVKLEVYPRSFVRPEHDPEWSHGCSALHSNKGIEGEDAPPAKAGMEDAPRGQDGNGEGYSLKPSFFQSGLEDGKNMRFHIQHPGLLVVK